MKNTAQRMYMAMGVDIGDIGDWRFRGNPPKHRKSVNRPAGSKLAKCWLWHGAVQAKWKDAVKVK